MGPVIHVVAAAIRDHDLVFACRRAPGKAAAGQWEFPGGKVEDREDPVSALHRELDEELSLRVTISGLLDRSRTQVGDVVIDLATYEAVLVGERPVTSTDHDRLGWFEIRELGELNWALPDLPALAAVIRRREEEALSDDPDRNR
ncbi:(deoxy)nucleoside triphosphate pyrophosphohydrolase [Agromyces sp. ZXT2-6]|uniref:(deoxy)nucleoside triphosphate pyrophosphohydrolase n=1 Tax=Agromyces sp. ZXT2-6 TaxID=3461153 RepID=UPI004054D4B9